MTTRRLWSSDLHTGFRDIPDVRVNVEFSLFSIIFGLRVYGTFVYSDFHNSALIVDYLLFI